MVWPNLSTAASCNARARSFTKPVYAKVYRPKFSVWLKNCTFTKALESVTPYERLYEEKPNLTDVPECSGGNKFGFTTPLGPSWTLEHGKFDR